jgi:putative transcriptional regulator
VNVRCFNDLELGKLRAVILSRFEELRLKKSREQGERLPLRKIIQETGLAETTLLRLSNGTNSRIDYTTLDALCRYFNCSVGDLLEYVPQSEALDNTVSSNSPS